VRQVFLGVSTGVNGHVEVEIARKPDLEDLGFFLGHEDICLSYVQDGWPVVQLPFLALGILQPVGSLEGSTHFGILPESGTEHTFLERRLQRDL
jgi:hypothetical protein